MIYADHAATTPISATALQAMQPYLDTQYGNPSTLYRLARTPRKAIAEARQTIASAIGAKPQEIFFTSGGTESDNWAIKGNAFRHLGQKKRIITSAIEHHAVLNTCSWLEHLGFDVDYLPVDSKGCVNPNDLLRAISDDTILISIMMANNEIGTIEPIQELARIAHSRHIPFHTDAVQAVGHIPIDVNNLGIDFLSASAHKFNGPKGTGFLYCREGYSIEALLHGGGQESGMRSGTENTAGIVGMAAALNEHILSMTAENEHLEALRNRLICGLEGADFMINGSKSHIPGSLSLSFAHVEGEVLLHRLDLMEIAVATGSACNSKDTVLSHVIQAIQVPSQYANGTIRITLGMDNNEEQVDQIAHSLKRLLLQFSNLS